jgi:hypothetical protein
MGYLVAQLWPFLIAALLIGVVTGWLSVSPRRS